MSRDDKEETDSEEEADQERRSHFSLFLTCLCVDRRGERGDLRRRETRPGDRDKMMMRAADLLFSLAAHAAAMMSTGEAEKYDE